jgi:hypothetical protein
MASRCLLIAAALALPALAARAEGPPSPIAATFGNTVVSTYSDGRSQKIWISPDGTWSGLSRRGAPLAGKWTLKGEKVCLRQTHPPTLPFSFCQVLPADPATGVDSRDFSGAPIHLRLVTGHVGAASPAG